jgi:hypothetical protein
VSALLTIALQAALHSRSPVANLTQSQLHVMTDACKEPRQWLSHLGGDEVRFRPSPTAKYEKVDCVLKRLRARIAPTKLGFIGNEQLSEDK